MPNWFKKTGDDVADDALSPREELRALADDTAAVAPDVDVCGDAPDAPDTGDASAATAEVGAPDTTTTPSTSDTEVIRDRLADALSPEPDAGELRLEELRGELKSPLPEPTAFFTIKGAEDARVGTRPEDLARAAAGGADNAAGRTPPEGADAEKPRSRAAFRMVVVGAVVALLAAAGAWAYVTFGKVPAPDLVGLSQSEAIALIQDAGLRIGQITEESAAGITPGTVLSQDPIVDELALRGSKVQLIVAAAGRTVRVPDVSAMSYVDAQAALSGAQLVAQEVRTWSDTVAAGSVVGFLPIAGTELPSGSTVSVLVSAGAYSTPIQVPKVLGLSADAASAALQQAGFNPQVFTASASFGVLNEVIAQTPASATQLAPGTSVLVLVSRGNSTTEISVPDLSGKAADVAAAEASVAGFATQSWPIVDSSVASGTVVAQTPPSKDTLLAAGDPIGLLVSHGSAADAAVPEVLSQDVAAAVRMIQDAGMTAVVVPQGTGTAAASAETTATATATAQPGVDGGGVSAVTSPTAPAATTVEARGTVTQQFPAAGSAYKIGLPVLIYAE
ncbi:MAG: PASTA domain-containing protein [Actinomycetes bacterium]|jgi:beta-lactam-binding protein with PASTA domain|nr:PASTA domain-containing protein [Actinomycetes bacterium]